MSLDDFAALTQLSQQQFLFVAAACFLAGVVRGFSGFGLSALVMAALASMIAPVELIPVCYILEGVAGLMMFRGGVRDADMPTVWTLAICSAIGAPLGLLATVTVPVETSKMIALGVVLCLTLAQLFKVNAAFLDTKPGLYVTGFVAGIVTGLASVGGLVIALYVLASKSEPKTIRGTLAMFLFLTMFTSIIYLLAYDVMNMLAVMRGVVFTPLVIAGVLIGTWFFRPSLQGFYKRFCLLLLVSLALIGLVRLL